MTKISMKQMLEAGVHFGHRSQFWHPKMAPYIFGVRNKIHIINLEQTLPKFVDALNFAGSIAASGNEVLFVGTKRGAGEIIKEQATRCGMPYVYHRWLGGMLTNYKTIKASIKRLQDLEFLSEDNFSQFNKKEALMMTREREKLDKSLGGIKTMKGLPSAIFIIDIGYEKNAVNEAKKLGLPVIGVVDTNHNPERIDFVIPGNDDAIRSIEFYATQMANALIEAKEAAGLTKQDEPATKVESKPAQPTTTTTETTPAVETEQRVDEAPVNVNDAPAKEAEVNEAVVDDNVNADKDEMDAESNKVLKAAPKQEAK